MSLREDLVTEQNLHLQSQLQDKFGLESESRQLVVMIEVQGQVISDQSEF